MKSITGNLWDFYEKGYIVCITTNGFVKKDGRCVMGRGCARQAVMMFSGIDFKLGQLIKKYGNHVHVIMDRILSFPVKHNWWEKADLKLIERSAHELVEITNKNGWERVILPRPGCGNGGLDWEDVKPVIGHVLDDRFYVITIKSNLEETG